MKEIIYMEKNMEKEKNIKIKNWNLKENIIMEKNGKENFMITLTKN